VRTRGRSDDNIKTGLKEAVREGVDCIRLAEVRVPWGGGGLVNKIIILRLPKQREIS